MTRVPVGTPSTTAAEVLRRGRRPSKSSPPSATAFDSSGPSITTRLFALLVLALAVHPAILAQDTTTEVAFDQTGEQTEEPRLNEALLKGLELRGIGPALMSGRISDLAIDPERPNTWYVAAGSGGVWKTTWVSENRGESWEKRSDYISGGTGPHYYQEIWADPHHFDVLYHANVVLGKTTDGGRGPGRHDSQQGTENEDHHAPARREGGARHSLASNVRITTEVRWLSLVPERSLQTARFPP